MHDKQGEIRKRVYFLKHVTNKAEILIFGREIEGEGVSMYRSGSKHTILDRPRYITRRAVPTVASGRVEANPEFFWCCSAGP